MVKFYGKIQLVEDEVESIIVAAKDSKIDTEVLRSIVEELQIKTCKKLNASGVRITSTQSWIRLRFCFLHYALRHHLPHRCAASTSDLTSVMLEGSKTTDKSLEEHVEKMVRESKDFATIVNTVNKAVAKMKPSNPLLQCAINLASVESSSASSSVTVSDVARLQDEMTSVKRELQELKESPMKKLKWGSDTSMTWSLGTRSFCEGSETVSLSYRSTGSSASQVDQDMTPQVPVNSPIVPHLNLNFGDIDNVDEDDLLDEFENLPGQMKLLALNSVRSNRSNTETE